MSGKFVFWSNLLIDNALADDSSAHQKRKWDSSIKGIKARQFKIVQSFIKYYKIA